MLHDIYDQTKVLWHAWQLEPDSHVTRVSVVNMLSCQLLPREIQAMSKAELMHNYNELETSF